MNRIVLSFADGTVFFVGLALALGAEALLLRFRNRLARPVLTVLALVGMVFVVISATPLSIWAYLSWTIPAVAGLVLLHGAASPTRLRVVTCAVLLAATVGLCIAEVPHRRLPRLAASEHTTVHVLGDSISAGSGTGERCWPALLGEMTRLRVVNLAQPGATVKSAIAQAKGITEPRSLVIVEIGGNDLLGGTDPSMFRKDLDSLVSSLCSQNHQVLVVELPLFPFQNAFGEAQRSIVAKYRVAMLPKRCFAQVLATENGTLDGIHLSQTGHAAMARIMAAVIKPE